MLIVRNVFTAKPGQATKLAKYMKEMMTKEMPPGTKGRVMTDLVGDYNTVVMETEYKSLSEFENTMAEYAKMSKSPETQQRMAEYLGMYVTGKREILRTVD
jgi:hypothetical protein